MQDNLIKDNKGTAIRIIVGGYEVAPTRQPQQPRLQPQEKKRGITR